MLAKVYKFNNVLYADLRKAQREAVNVILDTLRGQPGVIVSTRWDENDAAGRYVCSVDIGPLVLVATVTREEIVV